MITYCGCAAFGVVLGIAILVVAAAVVTQCCDANLWDVPGG